MKFLDLIVTATERALCAVAVALVAAGLIVVSLQIVDRHFFDVPIVAPDAYARIAVIWLTFVGYALGAHSGQAIRVDLIDHWLSSRKRKILAAIFDLLVLAVLVLLIAKGWILVVLGADQSILGTDLTTAVPNAGLLVGCAGLFIFLAGRSIKRFADLAGQ